MKRLFVLVGSLLTVGILAFLGIAQAKDTLVVGVIGEPPQSELQKQLISQFESKYGVEIKWRAYTWVDIWDKVSVEVATGLAPDVVSTSLNWKETELVAQGIFQPLDSLIASDSTWDKGDFIPIVLAAGRFDGKQYLIPTVLGLSVYFYNKNLLAEAALNEPDVDFTWDQFLVMAKKLTRLDADGKFKVAGTWVHDWPTLFQTWVFSAGGKFFEPEGAFVPEKAVFNHPKTLAGFKFGADLVNVHRVAPAFGRDTSFGGEQAFAQGWVGLLPYGAGLGRTLKETAPNIDFGVTVGPHHRSESPVLTLDTGSSYGIPRSSKKAKLAWEFIKLMTSADMIKSSDLWNLPARYSVLQTYSETPVGRLILEVMRRSWPVRGTRVVSIERAWINPMVEAARKALHHGNTDYEVLLEQATEKANAALKQWRDRK
ncbi:MAG: ABC transporter substrate-binding protein [Bacteroidota bacterium]